MSPASLAPFHTNHVAGISGAKTIVSTPYRWYVLRAWRQVPYRTSWTRQNDDVPRPLSNVTLITSPGIGWQQRAKRVIKLSTPSTTTASFWRRLDALACCQTQAVSLMLFVFFFRRWFVGLALMWLTTWLIRKSPPPIPAYNHHLECWRWIVFQRVLLSIFQCGANSA